MQRDRPGSVAGAAAPTSGGYLPALDGLRAISVASVLLFHADIWWIPGGFLGVEVFFVISGYLITMLLVARARPYVDDLVPGLLDAPGPAAARRGLRAAGDGLVRRARLLPRGRDEAGRTSLGSAHVRHELVPDLSDQSYFAAVERPLVFQHLWSLAIEEQFYLVWPVLLLVMLRLFRGRMIAMAGLITAGAVASLVWMAVLYEPAVDPSRVYYGTDTRASGLLLGAALALLWKPGHPFYRDVEVKRVSLDMAGLGAVGVIVWCFTSIEENESFLYQGGFAVLSVATCVAIAAACNPAPCSVASSVTRCSSGSASGRIRSTCGTGRSSSTPGRRSICRCRSTRRSCCASCSPSSLPSSAIASSRCPSATARSPAGAAACGGARAAAASPDRSPSRGRARCSSSQSTQSARPARRASISSSARTPCRPSRHRRPAPSSHRLPAPPPLS